jgi:hypothetical protein
MRLQPDPPRLVTVGIALLLGAAATALLAIGMIVPGI